MFQLTFNGSVWNQGFIFKNEQMFLLVTLDKSSAAAEHQYQDKFLAADLFQWQSQNRQHRDGAIEQKMARHMELGIPVHLFIRRTAKSDGRATPFLYWGTCEFVDWEGDRPITVRWRLRARSQIDGASPSAFRCEQTGVEASSSASVSGCDCLNFSEVRAA